VLAGNRLRPDVEGVEVKIEFSIVGDGTNIQVSLLEEMGGLERVKDRFYTQEHHIHTLGWFSDPVLFSGVERIFENLEEVLQPPIIAGKWGHLHPYWEQRRAVRMNRKKLQNLEDK
jgi:hypothetical protein